MKIGWFILANAAIGVVIFILFCVYAAILHSKMSQSERKRMQEMIDDDAIESDTVYEAWFGNAQIGQTLSIFLVIAAWEFMVPIVVTSLNQIYKESRRR